MIITLLGQERNIGILTVTDHLIANLGKDNCAVVGWNYLVKDYSKNLEKIKDYAKTKYVIVKYVSPKTKFSNQGENYPSELQDMSDLIFYVPSYREEKMATVPLKFYKGAENPISKYIKEFYK